MNNYYMHDGDKQKGPFTIDELKKYPDREICFVPLAWNFFDEIVGRIKKVRNFKGDVFIKYFPTIVVE